MNDKQLVNIFFIGALAVLLGILLVTVQYDVSGTLATVASIVTVLTWYLLYWYCLQQRLATQ